MRHRSLIFICLVTLLTFHVSKAQTIKYGGMQQFGLTFGENNTHLGFIFTNGVRINRFFTGVGIDAQFRSRYGYWGYSAYNTSAIYADGRYYLGKNQNFFGKLNGGVNLITSGMTGNEYTKYKKSSGSYGALGLGAKFKLGNEVYYSFDINFSFRQLKYNYSYRYSNELWQTDRFDLRQSAIVINMGIEI